MNIRDQTKTHAGILGLMILLAVNFFFLRHNAFRFFNFYDMCFDLDGGWRILNGQRPHTDFICFTGPVHLYMYALFFKIFGFGKSAIFAYLITGSSLVMTIVYGMTRKAIPLAVSLLVTTLTMTSFYWPVSHPWHNQTAMLWEILALSIYVRYLNSLTSKNAFGVAFTCGILMILAFMTKTNEGVIYGTLFLLLFLFSPYRKQLLSGYLIGGAVSFVLAFMFIGCSPLIFFEQIMAYSRMMAGPRLSRLMIWSNWFANYYWIPFIIVLFNVWPFRHKYRNFFLLFIGMMMVSIYSLYSNDILRSANIFLWGIFIAVAYLIFYKIKENLTTSRRKKFFRISEWLLVTITSVLIVISVKYDFELKVWTYWENLLGTYALQAKPLKGWLFDEFRGKILDQMVDFIDMNIPKKDSILVVTDMQILYALTDRPSYPGIPIQGFQKDGMPAPGAQLEQVHKTISAHPPDWIVVDIGNVMNEIPYLGLSEALKTRYTLAKSFGLFAIFKKKKKYVKF